MSLALYDTAAQAVSEFVPLEPGKVGVYVCGATVQSGPHVGHLRPAVAFDVLRRWLTHSGYDVTLIRNVTDIDDKILAKASEAGVPWWAHANAVEREFTAAYDALNVIPPTYEPRATGHVPEMIELMKTLIDNGHAYATGPGNVWFDVLSWPQYGELTRQRLSDLVPEDTGANSELEKRSPYDFALWKAPRPGEPETAAWDTPWGRGRPGWHLECSAMAGRYLGPQFDIHGGGLDLRFPHHENEQAQSRAAGRPFANRWMHSAWITASGEKMSKSLGNGLLAQAVLKDASEFGYTPGAAVRYAIIQAHYRSMLEWSDNTLQEAPAAWERLRNFVVSATSRVGDEKLIQQLLEQSELPAEFVAAMDDDLNTPLALSVIHKHRKLGNAARSNDDPDSLIRELVAVRGMLGVLGLDPLDPVWTRTDSAREVGHNKVIESDLVDPLVGSGAVLAKLVEDLLKARTEARLAKNWAKADEIRDQLNSAGVTLEDSPTGTTWTHA